MIEFFLLWFVAALALFIVMEFTIPAGAQIKKWPRRFLLAFYLPLYVAGAVILLLKIWIVNIVGLIEWIKKNL